MNSQVEAVAFDQITYAPDTAMSMGLQLWSARLSSKDKGESQASKMISSKVCCYQSFWAVGWCVSVAPAGRKSFSGSS